MNFDINIDEMVESIPLFLELYEERPIRDNKLGMKFNHSWATWFLVRKLSPKIIVESGIWQGHSSWLFEVSAPEAILFGFDVDLSQRKYISNRMEYYETDFINYPWGNLDLTDSLFFFDDHQNHLDRLMKCHWIGASRVILEDVYPVNEGDFYSLKHIFAHVGAPGLQMSKGHQGNLLKKLGRSILESQIGRLGASQNRIVKPNKFDAINLSKRIKTLYEMPPVFLEDRAENWKVSYSGNYVTKKPLLEARPLEGLDYSYNWLTYVEIQ